MNCVASWIKKFRVHIRVLSGDEFKRNMRPRAPQYLHEYDGVP